MKRIMLTIIAPLFAAQVALADNVVVGQKLPPVVIEDKGEMVIEYDVVDGVMKYKDGSDITYKTFNSAALTGKIQTIYHLAARSGADELNQPFIDALIAAKVPEHGPDSPYKTTTILNIDDALWGTSGVATGRLADSQKGAAYAYHVIDAKGLALKKWGLKAKSSAVIVVDRDNKVLYFKDGKMSKDEIASVIALIEKHLAM